MSGLCVIVMAAGHGTRMKSSLPKVLHRAAGRPLVFYPVQCALGLSAKEVIVVGNRDTVEPIEAALRAELPKAPLSFAIQEIPRGTGDAAVAGLRDRALRDEDVVVILSGDTPLLTSDVVRPLVERVETGDVLAFLTFLPEDPTGYGRVLRDEVGHVTEIREHRDLKTPSERATREVNAGVYAARAGALREALAQITPNNAQGEYYLTDIVAFLTKRGKVSTLVAPEKDLLGVNHRGELAQAEAVLFERIRARLGRQGVTIVGSPLIDDSVEIALDVTIEDGVRLRGKTRLLEGVFVDVGSIITNTTIEAHAQIKPYSVLSESSVGPGAQIGPFSHLRPQSRIESEAHIGNFVETKNTIVRAKAKANHLAYLGDGDVGERSNLGAGTIFCNYDGFTKSRTIIGKDVFVGSDSQLIAPLEIGDGAYVGTGTTVTVNVPPGALAIGRVRQTNKEGYAAFLRERLAASAAAKKR